MTTKPKAKKFRIRRSPGAEAPAEQPVAQTPPRPTAAAPQPRPEPVPRPAEAAPRAQQPRPAPGPMAGDVASPDQVSGETDIDAIRREGLTGRQLRMARRVAQKHGLAPTSDFDAVRLLRAKGIDPFQRTNMLELVKPDEADQPPAKPEARVQLPQTVQVEKQQLPSTEIANPAERRAAEITKIQRELAARRRKKQLLLLSRLAAFVLLPTLLAGYYFYGVATPMYSTKSEFLILKNDGGGGAVPGLLAGTQFATAQDAIAVQSYLQSKDAMLRLDADVGFKSHFTDENIDPIQRLEENPSNEEAYKLYKRHVEIGFDPTEGVIRMEIMAADPLVATEFSEALIGYAEERVDNLSLRKRSNAVRDAEQGLIDAEQSRREAQEKLVRLQQETNAVDPEAQIAALRSQINTYELQLQEKNLQLQALLDNARPNRAKVDGARGDIRRLEALLAELNTRMVSATTGENSLAEKAAQIQLAQADLATRDLMLQTALQTLEQARRDASSQARYLTTSVKPVASEDPAYPRKFENTILAFLIFGGIYLMISLTASILREQVSS
ncbi:capsule biosynthesis protein [Tropicibacter sp. R15_0]|uniref:capsule biosynthesis protein n=1 Tax=Tropicibacter sp. R15_0 TaxID=2821101 RepID=UPI001ADBAD6F|nr:capsule biosynthesis protein [Tropicibacter sp. R15_0]MBO9463946.1 capsule biosynthesis protein [Tropicibacter sp. R15_0]